MFVTFATTDGHEALPIDAIVRICDQEGQGCKVFHSNNEGFVHAIMSTERAKDISERINRTLESEQRALAPVVYR
jgi:hypothetical protein